MIISFSCISEMREAFDFIHDLWKRGEIEVDWGNWLTSIVVKMNWPVNDLVISLLDEAKIPYNKIPNHLRR